MQSQPGQFASGILAAVKYSLTNRRQRCISVSCSRIVLIVRVERPIRVGKPADAMLPSFDPDVAVIIERPVRTGHSASRAFGEMLGLEESNPMLRSDLTVTCESPLVKFRMEERFKQLHATDGIWKVEEFKIGSCGQDTIDCEVHVRGILFI